MNAPAALRDVRHLASDIGPREATSHNFAEAAAFVETRFERLGYDVRRTKVRVPSGTSWGTPVRRGTSLNVIAEPDGFDASKPHVVIGAHLDTVPVAPGAEDNASGIAVMLQLAAPSRVLVWKSMSKTKLPSECTTTADPAIS
jgi:acetylornithine deacetylase/succinyl-diaminopimelate desuccinylase-like protein